MSVRFALFFVLIQVLLLPMPARAGDVLTVDIYGPGQTKINVLIADPLPREAGASLAAVPENAPAALQQYIQSNCAFLPFFSMVSGRDVVGGPLPGGYAAPNIDFQRFKLSRVDVLVTAAWQPRSGGLGDVELRAYEVFSGRLIVGRGYTVQNRQQLPEVAARFCADLMEALTGHGDFFRSNLAFVKRDGQRKQVFMSTAQGVGVQQLTNLNGVCMSPSWSHDGQKLVFAFLDQKGHSICEWNRQTRELRRLKMPGATVISPTFTARGTIAVTLDMGGSPDIYELNPDFSIARVLEKSWAIDVSPDFDQAGDKMVFVSNRLGNPQIFMKNLTTGVVSRVSFDGKYNTAPSISPDGKLVVYSHLINGQHKLFLADLASGVERQLTFGPGSDEDASWSPDGYFIAFASNRSGRYQIYITTKHGDEPILIPTGPGESFSPAWGKL